MIKIMRPGTKKEIECDKCGALLSYDEKEDVITSDATIRMYKNSFPVFGERYFFIICPQCKHEIKLNLELEETEND